MTTTTPLSLGPRLGQLGLQFALLAALAACGGRSDDAANPPAAAAPPPANPPVAGPPPAPQALRSSLVAGGSNGDLIEARTSQAPTGAGFAPSTVYDDFRLTSAANISSVGWQGIYCVQAAGSSAPSPTASQFVVTLYPDLAGRPDLAAPLATTTVSAANAGETFERNVAALICGSASNTAWALYNYQATLSAPVAVAANTTYWLSVQAITPSYDVYWGWRAGVADNRLALLRFLGNYDVLTFDRSFALLP